MTEDYTYGIVTRLQVEVWLSHAFNGGIPPEMQGIVLSTSERESFKGLDWSGAHLEWSVLSQADLSFGRFIGSHLSEADLTWSLLDDSDFEGAIFANTRLDLTWCRRCRFVRARFFKCKCNSGEWKDANFMGASLTKSSFCNGDFREANLEGADLSGCDFTNCEFGGANLRRAILKGATLSYARFDGADLTDANLTGVITDEDGIFIDRQTVWRPQPRSEIRAILIDPPPDDVE